MERVFRHLLLLSLAVCLASAEVYFKKGAPHVTLSNGAVVSGTLQNSRDGCPFTSYVGIPYATIPGRFEEAQLVSGGEWTDPVYPAVKPGSLCPQFLLGQHYVDENCLNLNVYVPMNSTGRKEGHPVMVWIHGGGFVIGGGFGYGPTFFMDEDVILVTINYRLGALGFLSTGDEVVPGNNGLKDQVLALRWVQENIQNFNGNPRKVTIFGESAGAASVHYLLLSPTAKGLFHRAISQSASALAPWAYYLNPKANAVKFATHLQCPTIAANPAEISSQEIVDCLKVQPVEKLNEAQMAIKEVWPPGSIHFSFGPVAEPQLTTSTAFLTQSPWEILADRTVPLAEVPWIVGVTEDEGASMYSGTILGNQELITHLETHWNSTAPTAFGIDQILPASEQSIVVDKMKQFYFGAKPVSTETRVNLTNLYSDDLFVFAVYKAAIEHASRGKGNKVYLYQYTHRGPVSLLQALGVPVAEEEAKKIGHGDELFLQFNMDFLTKGQNILEADSPHEEFSKNFVKLWASVAIHGEPKHSWGAATYRKWKRITREELNGTTPLRWYKIDTSSSIAVDNLFQDRMQFFDGLWTEHFAPAMTTVQEPTADADNTQKTEL